MQPHFPLNVDKTIAKERVAAKKCKRRTSFIFHITWLLPSSDWSLSPQDQISFGLEDMLDLRILRALLFFLLLLSGDVESNPGPPKKGKMFDRVAIVHTLLEP